MEIAGLIILAVLSGLFLYSLIKGKKPSKNNKKRQKSSKGQPEKEKRTVQDLFEYESISSKGIVKLKSGTYTAIIELTDINQHLNNIEENAVIWKKFRTMLNSISIRHTLLVQSQYLDVMDFVEDYDKKSEDIVNLTPELEKAKKYVISNYKEFSEEKTREYRSFIVFRFNPRKDALNNGLETGSAVLDNIINSLRGQTQSVDESEEKELSESILEEVCDLAYQMLHSIGSSSVRLNKQGVLSMTYSTLNRDLSISQRLQDASATHSFSELKQSLTPDLFEEQLRTESDFYNEAAEAINNPYRLVGEEELAHDQVAANEEPYFKKQAAAR